MSPEPSESKAVVQEAVPAAGPSGTLPVSQPDKEIRPIEDKPVVQEPLSTAIPNGQMPEPTANKPVVQDPVPGASPNGALPVSQPGKETRRERRAFRRRPVKARVRIQTDPLGMAPFFDVSPLNFCEGGMSFVTTKELTPGKLITIDIQRASTGKQMKSEAEIRWTKAVAENRFHVGCQWKRRLNFTELQHFM